MIYPEAPCNRGGGAPGSLVFVRQASRKIRTIFPFFPYVSIKISCCPSVPAGMSSSGSSWKCLLRTTWFFHDTWYETNASASSFFFWRHIRSYMLSNASGWLDYYPLYVPKIPPFRGGGACYTRLTPRGGQSIAPLPAPTGSSVGATPSQP